MSLLLAREKGKACADELVDAEELVVDEDEVVMVAELDELSDELDVEEEEEIVEVLVVELGVDMELEELDDELVLPAGGVTPIVRYTPIAATTIMTSASTTVTVLPTADRREPVATILRIRNPSAKKAPALLKPLVPWLRRRRVWSSRVPGSRWAFNPGI